MKLFFSRDVNPGSLETVDATEQEGYASDPFHQEFLRPAFWTQFGAKVAQKYTHVFCFSDVGVGQILHRYHPSQQRFSYPFSAGRKK